MINNLQPKLKYLVMMSCHYECKRYLNNELES